MMNQLLATEIAETDETPSKVRLPWVWRNWLFILIAIGAACIPAAFIMKGVLASPTTMYVGRNQDSAQFMWYLGWFWHAVLHGLNPLTTTSLNYPYGVNLMRNTSITAEAVLLGPVVYLVNSVFAFNMTIMLCLVGLGVLGALVLRRLGVRDWVAILGGVLLESAPAFTNQLIDGHINLVSAPMFLLLAIYLVLHAVRLHAKRQQRQLLFGILTGLALVSEFYSSSEVFFTTAILFVLFFVFACLLNTRHFLSVLRGLSLRFYLGLFGTTIILVLPGLFVYFFGPYRADIVGPPVPTNHWVTNLFQIFIPTAAQLIHSHATRYVTSLTDVNLSEEDGYLGVLMMVCVVWAATRLWHHKYVRVLTLSVLIAVLLSMGPQLHILNLITKVRLPWYYVQQLPIFNNILPSRLMAYADIECVILVALALEDALHGRYFVWRLCAVLATLGTLIALWLPTSDFPVQKVQPTAIAIEQGGPLYSLMKNKPTTMITPDYWTFGYDMQLIADTHYTIPVTNVYGFPYTSHAEFGTLRLTYPNLFLFSSAYYEMYDASAVNNLKDYIALRKPEVFLYMGRLSWMTPELRYALKVLCGSPVQSNGAYVWVVPGGTR